MKLQREVSRRNKAGEPYLKWRLSPPKAIIEQLGWKPGEELDVRVVGGDTLSIRRAK